MTEEEKSKLLIEANNKVAKLAENSERLIREVTRLRADVKRLLERIQRSRVIKHLYDETPQIIRGKPEEKTTIDEALADIERARNAISNIETDIRIIGSKLDVIGSSGATRTEFAEHMIDPNDKKFR